MIWTTNAFYVKLKWKERNDLCTTTIDYLIGKKINFDRMGQPQKVQVSTVSLFTVGVSQLSSFSSFN